MKPSLPSSLYTKQYYQKYNHGYEIFKQKMDLLPDLKKFLVANIKKGDKVLDVGCGRGETLYLCHKLGAKGVGIDYSHAAIEIARQSLKAYLSPKDTQVKLMDAKKLAYKNQSFDVVIMLDIVEHLYGWELTQALKEAHRVLKKHGKLLIHTTPNKLNMQLTRMLAKLVGVKLTSDSYHINEQTPGSLSQYLKHSFHRVDLILFKDHHYYSNQMSNRGLILKRLARLTDGILDSRAVNWLYLLPSVKTWLSTDIYAICEKT